MRAGAARAPIQALVVAEGPGLARGTRDRARSVFSSLTAVLVVSIGSKSSDAKLTARTHRGIVATRARLDNHERW